MNKKLLTVLPILLLATSCDLNISFGKTSSVSVEESSFAEVSSVEASSTDELSSSSSQEEESSSAEAYELVWSDEFDGDSLDTSNWNYQYGDGSSYGITGWGNQEQQYYKEENVSVKDGELVITAKKESAGGYSYTSARITTANKVHTKYGKIEARIALPAIQGMWPAFWMLPESRYENQGWPHSGEIDIMEAKGRLPNVTSGALHYANDNNSHTYMTANNVFKLNNYTNIEEYHVYGITWSEEKIVWYCDDVEFLTVTKDQWHTAAYSQNDASPFNQNFHILLNLAVGGHFDNYVLPPDNFTSAEMKVDYVRIYQENK